MRAVRLERLLAMTLPNYWKPKDGRNSWQQLIHDYRLGWKKNYGFLSLVLSLANRTPQVLYPWGEESYYESVVKHGIDAPLAPHNLWRQLCHFWGGAVLCVPIYFFLNALSIVLIGAVFASIEAAKDQENAWKPLFDVASWALGATFTWGVFTWISSLA